MAGHARGDRQRVGELVTTLDAQGIARYALGAGATGDALATAVAIALAESGGQVEIVSKRNKDGTYDRGLWQINDIHTQYDRALLTSDPAYNAKAAAEVSSGWTNFKPWTAYNTGAYKSHLGTGQAAAAATSSSAGHLGVGAGGISIPTPGDIGGIVSGIPGLGGALGDAINSVATGWVKDLGGVMLEVFLVLVFTTAAFALIGLGLGRLTGRNPVDVFKKISSTAQSATTVAAAAAI
jgi:hypothetical protein